MRFRLQKNPTACPIGSSSGHSCLSIHPPAHLSVHLCACPPIYCFLPQLLTCSCVPPGIGVLAHSHVAVLIFHASYMYFHTQQTPAVGRVVSLSSIRS